MFKFQQFTVFQENAAMKVGTDGVLLGAWATVSEKTERILDIGTGTGLVALMLAQRCAKATIDAVEIDVPSCHDAALNFSSSPWHERLNLFGEAFYSFQDKTVNKYDLIVSNPPFFSGSLQNSCNRKATARHDRALNQEGLISGVVQLLEKNGRFTLILPVGDYDQFQLKASRAGLYEEQKLMVKPTPHKPVKRIDSVWQKYPPNNHRCDELVVEMSRHCYSEEFKRIVSGFYLAF
jgi:tRNA1Val (adenine37-N6)-methyltransferase